MKQICVYLSLLVFQVNALVVPNKTHFPGQHLERISRGLIDPISNGDPTFMAVVIYGDCEHLCGGVFLTNKSILTFADCVKKGKTKIKIYPNIPYYLPHCDEDYTVFPIAKVIFMPGYNSRAQQKDLTSLAIVHLEKPVDAVKTVAINPDGRFDAKEETVLFNVGINRPLHVDDLDGVHKCQAEDASVVCGSLRDKGKPHKCTLVPGLPLIVNVKGQSYLKGLLLDPLSCPPKDVIYVNVASHATWILLETKPVNSNAHQDLSNDTLGMRAVTHPPFNPDSHFEKSWPFAPNEHHHTHITDNSKHNTSVNQLGQGCICNCEHHRSNSSYRLYGYDEDSFMPTERSNNNNNNNNNDVDGHVHNSNQNNNE